MYCPLCGKSILDGSVFCSHCGKPTTVPQITAPSVTTTPVAAKKSGAVDSVLKIVGAVVIIGFFMVILLGYLFGPHIPASPSRAPSNTPNPLATVFHQPVTQSLLSGPTIVGPGQYRYWTLTVTPEMLNAQLVGSFHAEGGGGNDIQAVIADASEFENWKNHHEARVYYSSERTTNGQFSVNLAPGTYVLAFSNAFSLLAQKVVTGDISLHYLR